MKQIKEKIFVKKKFYKFQFKYSENIETLFNLISIMSFLPKFMPLMKNGFLRHRPTSIGCAYSLLHIIDGSCRLEWS
jgi:hypothetical protein